MFRFQRRFSNTNYLDARALKCRRADVSRDLVILGSFPAPRSSAQARANTLATTDPQSHPNNAAAVIRFCSEYKTRTFLWFSIFMGDRTGARVALMY